MENLQVLEITYNEIGDESLTELANIFSQNQNIRTVVLSNNKLGNSGSERNLTNFLESFLLDLTSP